MYLPPVTAQVVLDFDPDDMKQCTISVRGSGKQVYQVASGEKLKTTTISRANESTPLAVLERHDMLSDKITFTGRESLSVRKWLKSHLFSSFPVTFEEGGRKYTWNQSDQGQLTLTSESDPDRPIAWFQGTKRYLVDGASQVGSAYLALESEAEQIRDVVIISMLVLEQKTRWSKGSNISPAATTALAIGFVPPTPSV